MSENPTHYDTLGIPADAPAEDIKVAFRRLMREHHPDLAGPEGQAMSARVSEAYDILSTPGSREAYDQSLIWDAQPVTQDPWADETYADAWGEDAEWGDLPPESEPTPEQWGEEVLDDEIVDEPSHPASPPSESTLTSDQTPTAPAPPEPSQKGRWPMGEYPEPRYRTPMMLLPIWVGIAVLWAVIGVVLTWTGTSPVEMATDQAKGIIIAVAAVMGIVLGIIISQKPPKVKRWSLRWGIIDGATVFVVALALAIFAFGYLRPQQAVFAGAEQIVLSLAAGVFMVRQTLGIQKRLNKVIPATALRKSNIFGNVPGGVAADLIDTDLTRFVDLPALRMFRSGMDDSPFTHAVIVGERLALVRAVQGNSGTYRWSGPSLLSQDSGGGFPEERLRGPFDAALRAAREGFPGKVEAWLIVYTLDGAVYSTPDPQRPTVRDAEEGLIEIGEFLLSGDVVQVDQQKVASAIRALIQ